MRLDAGNVIPDGKLLDGIAKGDKAAFTEFYQRHNRALFAFLVKLVRDREMAEEVLSETMLDVWRQAGRFEGKSSVTTWLFSIGHHKAVSRLRRMREVALDEEVSANIVGVNKATETTGQAASQVLVSAGELTKNGAKLKESVESFLRDVRAA